jgi:phage-related protein
MALTSQIGRAQVGQAQVGSAGVGGGGGGGPPPTSSTLAAQVGRAQVGCAQIGNAGAGGGGSPTVPGQVTGVVATITGVGQVSVNGNPPASDGGSAITGYVARSSTGQVSAPGSLPITVSGLPGGETTFTLEAINAVGTGAVSDPSAPVYPTFLLTRNTAGLLIQELFDAANGWTAGTGFSRVADPALAVFTRLPSALLQPGAAGSPDVDGVREGQLYVESPHLWYMFYDAGDGIGGWRCHCATSTDRGKTWTKRGALQNQVTNGAGGSFPAVAMGWIEKRGSTYYQHRVIAAGWFPDPDRGLPGGPYTGDTWTATDPLGTWTWVSNWGPTPGTWCAVEQLPGNVYFDGSTYHMMVEGQNGSGGYKAGRQSSSNPQGPWTLDPVPQFSASSFDGYPPENGRTFFHPTLNKYVQLFNLIDPSGTHTSRNVVALSSSITDWSSSTHYYTQRKQAPNADTSARAIGVQTHITGPEGKLVHENGYTPFVYDADPQRSSPGWHRGRSIRSAVFEPATYRLRYSDATATRHRYNKTFAHTDFVAEFSVQFPITLTGGDVAFEYRTNGTTGYRLRVRGDVANPRLLLEKMDGTVVQNNITGSAIVDSGVLLSIRVKVTGNLHEAWIDGEQQINITDSTYSSGSEIALSAVNSTADIRLLSVYSSDVITIRGLNPSQTVTLRTHGELPVATVTADAVGVATYSAFHYPISRVEKLAGVDGQASDMLLWGGDDVTVGSVIADLTLQWNVGSSTTAQADLTLQWDVATGAAAVQQDLTLQWDLPGAVAADLSLQWDVQDDTGSGTVSADLALFWDVQAIEGVSADLAVLWNVFAIAGEFNWIPTRAKLAKKPKADKVQFGDGYVQRSGRGINYKPERWELTFENVLNDEADLIESFLDNAEGVSVFSWTPGGGRPLANFVCAEYSRDDDEGGQMANLSMVFEQDFAP